MNHSDMSFAARMDLMQDYRAEPAEEQVDSADQIIFAIMSHLKRIPDIVAAAQVNTGFYGVYCDRALPLMKSIVHDSSPAAWEYMETIHSGLDHPSPYVRSYTHCQDCLSALKNIMFLGCESTIRPETMDGLMGVDREKQQKVDAALWRIWTFCELFGSNSGREMDLQYQIAWLEGGRDVRTTQGSTCFGIGNVQGLSASELLLMAEVWNALSTLLRESFRLPAEAHRNSLFAHTDAQYPEELYLLEWISHIMTLGLDSITRLASGSFEEAQNLGLSHWSPPREFGKRQAFLKDAVASTYRRRLQEEAKAKAIEAGISMRATHRALAPMRRTIPSSENVHSQSGLLTRKSVGSGVSTRAYPYPTSQPRQLQPSLPFHRDAVPPIPDLAPQRSQIQNVSSRPRPVERESNPHVPNAETVSPLGSQKRIAPSIGAALFANNPPSSPTLSVASSQQSRPSYIPSSSTPLELPSPAFASSDPSQHAVVDPIDKALALLVNEMGFSTAAARRALAASDDGSGPNTTKAIAILSASVAASSSEKIPVRDDDGGSSAKKPAARFAGLKARFSSQPLPSGRSFGELRPTGKERRQYGGLSLTEAKGLKRDVLHGKAYKDAFGDLFHPHGDEKARKGSASTVERVEIGAGGRVGSLDSWSLKSAATERHSVSSSRRKDRGPVEA